MRVNLSLRIFLACIVASVLYVVGDAICFLVPKFYYLRSEYVTAEMIRAADRFVTEHPNQWPHSWQDLEGEDYSRYTDFRFDLTPAMIVHDRQLIYRAIQPKGHRYRTYPHAREQLDALYEKLASMQAAQ